ncbi:hypothetical protein TNCV_412661 [Trichonephila clavipes]|uniref:Uncharacterized protein n=1 Tax=Trichonephila clavipes TaxID=2585209 RepID=A0A8X6SDL2_TRICX|nr:hypothetical protein TNCV_412661 [Trichonephila clavipes]
MPSFFTNCKATQFLTGYDNFKSCLNKFNLVSSYFSDWNIGCEDNVEHVLLLYSKFVTEKKILVLAIKGINPGVITQDTDSPQAHEIVNSGKTGYFLPMALT